MLSKMFSSKNAMIMRNLLKRREMSIFIPLVLFIVITSLVNPTFLKIKNITDLLRNTSYMWIVGCGMFVMLVSGNLDLSVGAIIAAAGMVVGGLLVNGAPITLAIIIALVFSAMIGSFNALLVVKFKIPSVIATLGTMYVVNGLVLVFTEGKPYLSLPKEFLVFGQGKLFGVAYTVYFAILCIIVFSYVIKNTTYGRKLVAFGGNQEASRIAGINTAKVQVSVYILLALMAGITGILLASRNGSAQPTVGAGKELAIAAGVIIGGVSIFGGVGSVMGAVIGLALMEVITNALIMMRVSAYYQNVFLGLIMILAVSIDTLGKVISIRKKRG